MKTGVILSLPALLIATAAPSAVFARPKNPPAQVVEHLRLLNELPPLISQLRDLEGKTLWDLESATVFFKPRSLKALRDNASSAGLLQAQSNALAQHNAKDCLSIEGEGSTAEDRALLADLTAQCSVFSAALTKNVDQLAAIVDLELRTPMTSPSQNMQPYYDAAAAYLKTSRALDAEGGKLTVALQKLKIGRSSWAGGFDFRLLWIGAAGFCCSLLILLLSPRLREKFGVVFSLPKPASQTVVEPFDALRGFSALWVALFHTGFLKVLNIDPPVIPLGAMAVPVFVTMSAFLIFRTVAKVGSWTDLGAYFKRRWLRIYPLYFVVLIAILFCGHCPTVAQLGRRQLAADFLMLRLVGYPHFLNPPAWSLYVEEGFYLTIPAWFFIFRRRVSLGAALSYAAVSVLYIYCPYREVDLLRYFCVGILLTQVIDPPRRMSEALKWFPLLIGAVLFFSAIDPAAFNVPPSYAPHVYAAAIFCVLWSAANVEVVSRLLSLYPLRFLGIISYSMYLWHMVILWIGMPLQFDVFGEYYTYTGFPLPSPAGHPAASYLIYPAALIFYSAISYALIERPFLLLRRKAMPIAATKPAARVPDGRRVSPIAVVYASVVLGVLACLAWREMKERPLRVAAEKSELGRALLRQGKTEEAIAQFELAIRADPKLAEAHYGLGLIFASQGRIDEAAGQYGLAIQADPTFVEAQLNLAEILTGQGKIDEAIAQYNRAVLATPNLPEPHFYLGVLLTAKGKTTEASAQFIRTLQIDPGYQTAKGPLGKLLQWRKN
jgi:peptidoglycan/LPS O-acetylase OafA/YrhL